ncbi:hypothetical protein FACS189459_6850 [Bacilli bacterium]|nr:hypothetical protein FACS189459_6850 [Bacilli bacterium]
MSDNFKLGDLHDHVHHHNAMRHAFLIVSVMFLFFGIIFAMLPAALPILWQHSDGTVTLTVKEQQEAVVGCLFAAPISLLLSLFFATFAIFHHKKYHVKKAENKAKKI